jgi:Tfp pilus assembly protein PilF
MLAGKLATLAIAAVAFTGAAHAQRVGHTPPPGENATGMSQDRGDSSSRRFEDGVEALQAKNFVIAEGHFEDVLRHNQNNPDANFLMGVTKMSLDKWDDARKYLEIAVKKAPKKPDPKSRLAIAYIRLGDIDGALRQRADLTKMSESCREKCRDAKWIAEGLAMVDAALPAKAASVPGQS